MPISGDSLRRFRPVLEKQFQEETKLYLFGDADDTTLVQRHSGIYRADLKKLVLFSLVGGLLTLVLLKRK